MKTLRNALLASVLVAGCASAATEALPEASIPFVNLKQSIRQWQADGTQGLWIQDARKNWYYAKLRTTCIGLDFAVSLGFETATTSSLDRFGSVIVPRAGSCQIQSLTRSGGPPDDKKSRKPAE
jgi:hypothetical protein